MKLWSCMWVIKKWLKEDLIHLSIGGSGWVFNEASFFSQKCLVLLLLLLLLLHTTPYIYSLILLACAPVRSWVAIPLRTSWNWWKNTLAFLRLYVFDFSYCRRFTMNNRRRSVSVQVSVQRGPLSTVKHICFVTIFLWISPVQFDRLMGSCCCFCAQAAVIVRGAFATLV